MNSSQDQTPDALDPAGQVCPPTIVGLPSGYRYGVTRYADVILQEAATKKLWRKTYSQWNKAKPSYDAKIAEARNLMPPLAES